MSAPGGAMPAPNGAREYLNGLTWDRVTRIADWLSTYLRAPGSKATRDAGRKFLCSAVERVFDPGCRCRGLLILGGPQGCGKSLALQTLGGSMYSTVEVTDLLRVQAGFSATIYEVAEVESFDDGKRALLLDRLFQRFDRFRPPYFRNAHTLGRECVFVVTTHMEARALAQSMGGECTKGLWPVQCSDVDVDGLLAVRDQLWAEAVFRYRMSVALRCLGWKA